MLARLLSSGEALVSHKAFLLFFLAHGDQTVCHLVHSLLIEVLLPENFLTIHIALRKRTIVSSLNEGLLVRWNG